MGKLTGFKTHPRQTPDKVTVVERLSNHKEFVLSYSDTQLNEQSSRCMDCGVPFCHNACPLGNLIPEFNDAVYNKEWKEAYEILIATNNFPEFTGRICPAPCESACVLGINKPAVAIEEIEKHIIEIAFEKGFVHARYPAKRTGKKVAVIGSGPAGLAAADQLNQFGHSVTVYERDDAPGGLLRYGIPDFKLEKWVVDRRINLLKDAGITFECNANVGENIDIKDIENNYDAVVLAGGATSPRDLPIPGRSLKGVHFAMEFLKQQNKRNSKTDALKHYGHESNMHSEQISARNRNIIVIGGGDTGSDCIGTSNRQRAKSIVQFDLMPRQPESRTEQMPWPTYPMLLKYTSSHEEGGDRMWCTATKEFIGDEDGNLKAVKVVELEWKIPENGGNATFSEISGSEKDLPCELALIAIGFSGPQKEGLLAKLGLELDLRGNVKASDCDYRTSAEKIFVAGDMRRGQSLVVWAIQEGRECAANVNDYLHKSIEQEFQENKFQFQTIR